MVLLWGKTKVLTEHVYKPKLRKMLPDRRQGQAMPGITAAKHQLRFLPYPGFYRDTPASLRGCANGPPEVSGLVQLWVL